MKGKGGIMGSGVGARGGGRYGGGTGGFRAASGGGKGYGYSSSAATARYASGYSRTGYGYHGRSAMIVGAPVFLYSRGHYGGRGFYAGCSQYSGEEKTQCQGYYSSCQYSSTSKFSACSLKTSEELLRDDIMAASIDSTKSVFPLNITVHQINITFRAGSQPDPWTNPVLLTFSEVDFDDENEVYLAFWVWFCPFVVGVICIAVCCIWCVCFERRCCCDCSSDSDTQNQPVSRTNSKVLEEVDIEAAPDIVSSDYHNGVQFNGKKVF